VAVPHLAIIGDDSQAINEKDFGTLEFYLGEIRRDGVAKHADINLRLDPLAENNTTTVALIKAYARHAKTPSSARAALVHCALHAWPLLEARALPADSDLKRAFVAAMLEWIDAGWQLGEFSSRSVHFFRTKIVELQTVEVSPTDPWIEYYGAPFSSRMDSP
jgi:hypothetical protein